MTHLPESRRRYVAITTATDSHAVAKTIAHALVSERLAACAQVSENASLYRWNGVVQDTQEFVVLVKTTVEAVGRVTERIGQLHNYKLPGISITEMQAGTPEYAAWIYGSVGECADHHGYNHAEDIG